MGTEMETAAIIWEAVVCRILAFTETVSKHIFHALPDLLLRSR